MKFILFSDIHYGKKGNSEDFNKQCQDFLDFVIDKTKDRNDINGAIFMGDWFDCRNNINVKTLNYGTEGLYKFAQIGKGNSYLILGNHDLYYRDRRDVNSVIIPEGDIGIEVIDEPIYMDEYQILLCPWLINEEKLTDLIQEYNPKYVFGHFEIASFPLNKMSKMEGEYNPVDYQGPVRICSGHFHTRSEKNNITYIGNCFSHDFSDVNDWHNKGFAILDLDTNEIEYYEWENAPKYCVMNISELNSIDMSNNMILKLRNDINMKPLDLTKLVDSLKELPNIVECSVYPSELIDIEKNNEENNIENIENVDSLIVELISSLENTDNISSEKLVKLYRGL